MCSIINKKKQIGKKFAKLFCVRGQKKPTDPIPKACGGYAT